MRETKNNDFDVEDEKVGTVAENQLLKMHYLDVTDGNNAGERNLPSRF